MNKRILVLGAGFGGLELATLLSERFGEQVDVTLIDKNDGFVIGFSKFEVMFGRATPEQIRMPYRKVIKPGVRFVHQTITSIDPEARRVTTDQAEFEGDILVIALGADYDFAATPGLAEAGNEFYSLAGATRLGEVLPGFTKGRAIVGVCGAPYKCPPAPSEAALLLHDYLTMRGVRDQCDITLVIPFGSPVPPSPDTSRALVAAFAERGIHFLPNRKVASLDPARRVAVLDDQTELPYELFLGVPKHRVPDVVQASGLVEHGWVPVNRETLATRLPDVYAIGDVCHTGAPKAGVFAEGAARTLAAAIIAELGGGGQPEPYAGAGSCYIEFGAGNIGRVDVDFFSGPKPTGTFWVPSQALRADKEHFRASRRARWFTE